MSAENDLALAYHMGYDDALARRKPDASKVHVFGRGTCHDIGTFKSWGLFTCSNCSVVIPLNAAKDAPEIGKVVPLKFCPNCGRKVVEPTTNDVDAEVTDG